MGLGARALAELRQRCRSERERRLLTEPNGLVDGTSAFAEPRLVGRQRLEIAQHGEEVGLVGPLFDRLQARYSICTRPRFGAHRITSPRSEERSTIVVNELIDTYFAKNSCSTSPSRKQPTPSNAASSQLMVISTPRPNVIGPGVGMRPFTGRALMDFTPSIWRCVAASYSSAYRPSNARRPIAPWARSLSSSDR